MNCFETYTINSVLWILVMKYDYQILESNEIDIIILISIKINNLLVHITPTKFIFNINWV